MKIDKSLVGKRVANRITFLDGYGNEIPNAVSFDDSTNIVIVYEPIDGPNGKGELVKKQKFHPNCIPVVSDIARPDDEQLANIRERLTGKRERSI
jgi:hypothetical protein